MENTPANQQQMIAYGEVIDNMGKWLAGQLTESTIEMYRRDVKAYQKYADDTNQDPFNPHTLGEWRDNLVLTTEMSPNTINRMLSAVRRTIRQTASKGIVSQSTAQAFKETDGVQVKALKGRLEKNRRVRIERDDMRKLCDEPQGYSLLSIRDRALLATMASSGLRASEISTLTFAQIRKQGDGYIVQVIGKTDTEPRDAHLSTEAYLLIVEWVKKRSVESDYIFTAFSGRGESRLTGQNMSESTIWKVVRKYGERSGLPTIKPHDFRRFVGTQLAERDIRKAQLALGHKSIETTARHYVLDKLKPGETDNLY